MMEDGGWTRRVGSRTQHGASRGVRFHGRRPGWRRGPEMPLVRTFAREEWTIEPRRTRSTNPLRASIGKLRISAGHIHAEKVRQTGI